MNTALETDREPFGAPTLTFEQRLGRVLRIANGSPLFREQFYRLKDRICQEFGRRDGMDYQEIIHKCWGDRDFGCDGDCDRCGGTGIWDRRIVRLERWRVGDMLFHRPNGTIVGVEPTIHGLISHRRSKSRDIAAATLGRLFSGDYYWRVLKDLSPNRLPVVCRKSNQLAWWCGGERFGWALATRTPARNLDDADLPF